ncbi:MAG: alanine racemase [Planctomycetota bacterium]|nr:MAG: alanine racemase [Planctomycetota bacterium]
MHAARVWAEVRLDRLAHNLGCLRRALAPGVQLMAVVKADAYGHGAVPVARALLAAGADRLGVGDSTEALELRAAGVRAPIHVLGALIEAEIDDVIRHRVTPTVHSLARVHLLVRRARALGRAVPVHIMVDTGMGRLGVRPESARRLAAAVAGAAPWLVLEGVATHLSAADAEDEAFTREQLVRFGQTLRDLRAAGLVPPLVHAANSAGLLRYPASHHTLCRPGIALYGMEPSPHVRAPGPGLLPVLALKSQVVFLKRVEAGTPLSYGATYRTSRPTVIATVPVGYNDGYPLALSNRAEALVRGRRVPVVGRVTMDYLLLDVGGVPGVHVGEVVTLIGAQGGEEIRVEELAARAGTLPYEITCRLGRRVRRLYLEGPAPVRRAAGAGRRHEPAPAPGRRRPRAGGAECA